MQYLAAVLALRPVLITDKNRIFCLHHNHIIQSDCRHQFILGVNDAVMRIDMNQQNYLLYARGGNAGSLPGNHASFCKMD